MLSIQTLKILAQIDLYIRGIYELSRMDKHILKTQNLKLNKTMKTGIELIAQERKEQIEKHGRTLKGDVEFNTQEQLTDAAVRILGQEHLVSQRPPFGWDMSIWQRMRAKPYKERLIIAGALIAAEIDRLQNS